MKNNQVKNIVGTAIFSAICIVLTLISNYIPIAGITINLALIAIAMAAMLYGPFSGFIVGLVNGAIVMLAAGPFFAISPFGTVLVCLLKSGLAGLISGLIFKVLQKKNNVVATIIATIIVPIINTGLFIVGALIFFNGLIGDLISIFISLNFGIEFVICALVAPSLSVIINVNQKKYASNLEMQKENAAHEHIIIKKGNK